MELINEGKRNELDSYGEILAISIHTSHIVFWLVKLRITCMTRE